VRNCRRCFDCGQSFGNSHARIRHQLDYHSAVSGQICPYCDSKYSVKKFDALDEHVSKYHVLVMQSPVQTCSTCKLNLSSYEELKAHRQLHDGGNKESLDSPMSARSKQLSVWQHGQIYY
jgi:DNA-directed RNA polymerase subunit RPC12/RpoP